jgi:restriction endonuclease S subunit
MGSDWRAVSLGELFRVKHGFAFKSEYFTDEPQKTVLVTPGNFAIGGGFQDGKRKYYKGRVPEDYVLKPGQVVVTMTDLSKESDTLGYAASIPNDSTIWLHNQRVGLLEFKTDIPTSPRFIEYLLRTHEYRSWIVGSATGTTVKHTAPERIESFATRIPPIEEQRAIAHILGTLDDKIELNRQQNETLEAMARALFKAWFVDFLPVRAKMAAKEKDPSLLLPQAEPGTWYVYAIECNDGSLYVGQTEDLRQRWLQHVGGKGANWTKSHPPVRVSYWERQPSREAAVEREKWLKTGFGRKWLKKEIAARTQAGEPVRANVEGRWQRGQSLPLPAPQSEATRQAGGLPAHLYDLFPDRLVDSELGEIPEGWGVGTLGDVAEHPRRSLKPENIELNTPYIALEHMPRRSIALSGWSTSDGLESNKFGFKKGEILFGKLRPYFHKVGVAPIDGVCSTDILVVTPRWPSWLGFVLSHVSSDEFIGYTNAGATGTKMPRTSWADMARYKLEIPPESVATEFTKVIQPLVDNIVAGIHESRTLAQLRDTLLPKLISGELRVKDAEKILEECQQ